MVPREILQLTIASIMLSYCCYSPPTIHAKAITTSSKGGALYYFVKYGYIQDNTDDNTAQLLSDEVLTKALRDFQEFAGLEPTGELDKETVKMMNTPRCGVRDKVGPSESAKRRKRYALQGSRWSVKRITYRISRYPRSRRLQKHQVDSEIKKAFQLWADQTDLIFQRKDSGPVHIEIRFERGEHGDGDPFDGAGGTLAHAFFPIYGGDTHFDDSELWTKDDFIGTNLLQTATHEFGHSLGLSHSDVSGALMAPFYRGYNPNMKLHKDDITAIQALYGKNDVETKPTPQTPAFPNNTPMGNDGDSRELCRDPRVDTIFGTDDGSFYAFKGDKYYLLTEDNVASGYPRLIRDDWRGLPDNVDAAVTWPGNGQTYFFKGRNYWKFSANKTPQPGYPKLISRKFPGIPNNVDAAFVWGGNGKIYFFKGREYWKFDPNKNPPVKSVYPRRISNWGLPHDEIGITAAIQWSNKYTYFFHGVNYYRFNDRKFAIDSGVPPFPRPTGPWWFGCDEKDNANIRKGGYSHHNEDNKGGSFITNFLRKEFHSFLLNFDEAGDENLDATSGDEK